MYSTAPTDARRAEVSTEEKNFAKSGEREKLTKKETEGEGESRRYKVRKSGPRV